MYFYQEILRWDISDVLDVSESLGWKLFRLIWDEKGVGQTDQKLSFQIWSEQHFCPLFHMQHFEKKKQSPERGMAAPIVFFEDGWVTSHHLCSRDLQAVKL